MTHLGKYAAKIHCGQHHLTKQVQNSSTSSVWTFPTSPLTSSSVSMSRDYRICFWIIRTCPSLSSGRHSAGWFVLSLCCLAYFPRVEQRLCSSNFTNHLKALALEEREQGEFWLWEGELEFLLSHLIDISISKHRQVMLDVSEGGNDIAGLLAWSLETEVNAGERLREEAKNQRWMGVEHDE